MVRFYDIAPGSKKSFWSFKIDVKDGILPPGSKVIVDVSGSSITADCNAESSNLLTCETNNPSQKKPDHIILLRSPEASVTWLNSDSDRPLTTKLKSVDRLYFKESEQKWYFILTASLNADYWNLNIGILYGNKPSIATCLGIKNILHCVVNEPNQDSSTLIKLSKTRTSDTTITFNNLEEDIDIPIWKELTLEKCGNVKLVDKTWKFNIFIQDTLPQNSYVIIDIISRYEKPSNNYDFDFNSPVDCVYDNKKLKCEYTLDDDAWYESIKILKEKDEYSPSTVPKWNNMENDYLKYFNLETNIKFNYATKLQKKNNNYHFEISISDVLPKYSQLSVDILIGNKKAIAYCYSNDFTYLECENTLSQLDSDQVYLSKDKTDSSSVTWYNLKANQPLFSIKLEYIHSYYQHSSITNYPNLDVNIIANGNELKQNYILVIKVCIQKGKKTNKLNYQENTEFIPCVYNYGIIFCSIKNINKC